MAKRILVADDDAGMRDSLRIILEDEGYVVETHRQGETVQQMHAPFPDLLLLDLRLSGMNGMTICRQLKDQESTRSIPIILISANTDTNVIAREAGADDFLLKPFEIDDLLALVARHLEKV